MSQRKLPRTEAELKTQGEWARQLVLGAGGQPETAYAVAAEWVRGLRRLMEGRRAEEEFEVYS